MQNLIKILEAVAWPLAVIVLAIAVIVVVFRITATKGEVSLKWKDWGFGAKSTPEIAPPAAETAIPPPQERGVEIPDDSSDGPPDIASGADSVRGAVFWTAKTEPELEAAFARLKEESDSYASDQEFWETLRVDRRREIGVGDELGELNALAEQNPTWIWPVIFKVRRHQRLQEFAEAEQTLASAIARSNPENRKWALREGVQLKFSMFGLERALEYIRERICAGATDIEIASMFRKLSDLTKTDDEVFSYALLSEISLAFDKSDKETIFNLSYNYGNVADYRLNAFQRYLPLEHDSDWPNAANNMGIIALSASNAAQNTLFEEALALGSDVSAANLARSLASDGYVHRAEVLLEAANDLPGAANSVHLADAKAKVTKAKEDAKKEIDKFADYAAKQDQRFTAAIRAAYLHFKSSDVPYPVGRFASDDESLLVTADGDGAETTFKVGSTTFSGRLPRRPLCYEGSIGAVGSGLLGPRKRLLILQASDSTLRALIPPENLEKRDPIRVVELRVSTDPTAETPSNAAPETNKDRS